MRLHLAVLIAAIVTGITGIPAKASTFTDGEFHSYGQNFWGADPTDGPPASFLLLSTFFAVETAGFEVGYAAPGGHVIDFGSGDSILSFLPSSGAPAALDSSLSEPTSTSAGSFAGEVVALRLNIDYDDAGIFYDATGLGVAAHPPGIAFGDLIYTGLTGSLAGVNSLTVRQVSEIANVLLGGGAEPYDIADFDLFLDQTNNAFVGGYAVNNAFFSVDANFLLPEVTRPIPEPTSLALVLAGLCLIGLAMRSRKFRATTGHA